MKEFVLALFVTIIIISGANAQSTLALQEKCVEGAKKLVLETGGCDQTKVQDDYLLSCQYRCHYNKKLNKCFILIIAMHHPKDKGDSLGVTTDTRLWDINDKKQYGQFFSARKTNVCFHCEVAGKQCSSQKEWDGLIKQYMEE